MPIVVRAVTSEEFDAWLVQAKTKFAAAGSPATPPATYASATSPSATTKLGGVTSGGVTSGGATGDKPFSLLAAAQVQR
jgi:hypothetical protein